MQFYLLNNKDTLFIYWGTYVLPCKEQSEVRVRLCVVENENVQSEVPTRRIALNLRSSETLSLEKR